MAEATPDPIMGIAMGFMAAKHLFVASEIGLFTGLAQGPATLDELAATCGIPRRTAPTCRARTHLGRSPQLSRRAASSRH